MAAEDPRQERDAPLFRREYKPKRLRYLVIPLVVALGIILLLPRLLSLLE